MNTSKLVAIICWINCFIHLQMIHILFFCIDLLAACSTLRAFFVLLCVWLRLFCHNTKPPAAASHWHRHDGVAFVHPIMLIYSSAVYFYFCRVFFFLRCWGVLFIIIFIYVLLWEHQRDRWLWALRVREERTRESQKDNKASGWERVPYFFQ